MTRREYDDGTSTTPFRVSSNEKPTANVHSDEAEANPSLVLGPTLHDPRPLARLHEVEQVAEALVALEVQLALVRPHVLADLERDEEVEHARLALQRLDRRELRPWLRRGGRGEREGVGRVGRLHKQAVRREVRRAEDVHARFGIAVR